ncbi:MAG TPA: 50S ribosomal protein L11 methyltransferase [Vicinamibacterales bacterium]|nr:50S ribosomal protein L11 methyltransferase [Vicinamibacterales bacterium]
MPYRIDLPDPPGDALDRLVALGALDVESTAQGLAALIPDRVDPARVATALGIDRLLVSPAIGRDEGSVWLLAARPVRVGRLLLVPADLPAPPGALRMTDGPAFGTGLHPTTALCLELLEEIVDADGPGTMLDVGIGSGVLALAALTQGVPSAVGLDIDAGALVVAAANARLNDLAGRLRLVRGGPAALQGAWPLVFANVQAAPLIDMAPMLVQRVARPGRLVLSGIPSSIAPEVERAYRHSGMRPLRAATRAGWAALVLTAGW